jgi:hypothetical protein
LGNPLRVILSAGQIAEIAQAPALIKDQPASFIVANKGDDSDAFVAKSRHKAVKPLSLHVPTGSARVRATDISTKIAI